MPRFTLLVIELLRGFDFKIEPHISSAMTLNYNLGGSDNSCWPSGPRWCWLILGVGVTGIMLSSFLRVVLRFKIEYTISLNLGFTRVWLGYDVGSS